MKIDVTQQEYKAYQKSLGAWVEAKIDEVLAFAVDYWGHGIIFDDFKDAHGKLKVHKVISFPQSRTHTSSRAGVHRNSKLGNCLYIRMNLHRHLASFISEHKGYETSDLKLHEYEHYQKDPIIGEFMGHWTKVLMGTIVHEVAHMIEWGAMPYGQWSKDVKDANHAPIIHAAPEDLKLNYSPFVGRKRIRGHGAAFQTIYACLRDAFVNGVDRFDLPEMKTVKTKQQKWFTKVGGDGRTHLWDAKLLAEGASGGDSYAGAYRKNSNRYYGDTSEYRVFGRDGMLIDTATSLKEVRAILEENLSLWRTTGKEIRGYGTQYRVAA